MCLTPWLIKEKKAWTTARFNMVHYHGTMFGVVLCMTVLKIANSLAQEVNQVQLDWADANETAYVPHGPLVPCNYL